MIKPRNLDERMYSVEAIGKMLMVKFIVKEAIGESHLHMYSSTMPCLPQETNLTCARNFPFVERAKTY